jgi:Raf kinase inhibitor-like YbhB/YbcL family protein
MFTTLLIVGLTYTLFAGGLTLTSKDIQGQLEFAQEFNGFGCSGKNISPELSWSGAPKGTKSFAITMYDPDAPTGSGFWHWSVIDIPKETKSIASNASALKTLPKGSMEGRTDYGTYGYGGMCPPQGDSAHQYMFTIHALDVEKLGVGQDASAAVIGFMINAHTIEKSSVVGYYQR